MTKNQIIEQQWHTTKELRKELYKNEAKILGNIIEEMCKNGEALILATPGDPEKALLTSMQGALVKMDN